MKKRVLAIFAVIVITIVGGGMYVMSHNRTAQGLTLEEENIFKHSFRLLEEQTALYVKENFTGVSKIEFSPIIFDGGLMSGDPLTVNIIPIVYDQDGDKAFLGRDVGKMPFLSYGLHSGVEFDFGPNNQEIIYLENSKAGGQIDVSGKKILPNEAKISNGNDIDDNIQALVEDGQLRNIQKDRKGSPEAEVVYNLEIQKGDYSKWR